MSRWQYPLSILFSQISFEESQEIFSHVVSKMPAFVALIIKGGIKFGEIKQFPVTYACGKMLKNCMQIWADALGPLRKLIVPEGKNGLYNLAIDIRNNYLTTTWKEKEGEEDVVVLSHEEQVKWLSKTISRGVPRQSTWPWIVTFEYLSGELEDIVKNHSILLENGLLESEYVWDATLSILGKGSLFEQEVDITAVESFRQHIGKSVNANGKWVRYDQYFYLVDKLLNKGEHIIHVPHPVSDKQLSSPGGWVWNGYSNSKMLEYIKFVYSNAITEYERLIDTYFPKLKKRMQMASLFPCRFTVYLDYDENRSGFKNSPSLTWFVGALPKGSQNEITITVGKIATQNMNSLLSELYQNNMMYRSTKCDWINANVHSQFYMNFTATPVTNIVYEWLEDDLKGIGWTSK